MGRAPGQLQALCLLEYYVAAGRLGKALGLMYRPLCPQRLYREQGENVKHHYTQTVDLPEVLLAKLNTMNISEVKLPRGLLGSGTEGGQGCFMGMVPCAVTM